MESKKEISQVVGGLKGEVEIPGDKSVSHRSVMLAGLCDTPVHVTNFLHAAAGTWSAKGTFFRVPFLL